MPIVSDDGVYENELQQVAAQYGLEAPTEAAGALKSEEGTQTAPENNALYGLPNGFEGGVDWSKLNQSFGTIRSTSKEDTPIIAKTASPLVTITEGDIGEAIEIAGNLGGTIAGMGSKMSGVATGWWKGADGKFKYEISDEGMKLVDKEWKFGDKGKLGDFIEHPELFKAYPEFKDMSFEVGQKTDQYIASFNPNSKTLKINPAAIKSGDEGILDVIIHEIQHAVQNKEGFAPGSNPTYAADQALTELAEKIYSMPPGKQKLEMQDLYFELRNNREDFGQYMYLRSPGEIEANIVSARRKLSDEMRKKFPIEDHKKIVEGEVNTTHGGKYLPEFWYPMK